MLKNIKFLLFFSVFLAFSFYFLTAKSNKKIDANKVKSYVTSIINERNEKDKFFKEDEKSPILNEEKKSFKGLKYFNPDINYRLTAKIERNPKPDTANVLDTKNKIRKMLRFGKLHFKFNNKSYKLTAFLTLPKNSNNQLFVPFLDKTNGKTTYKGGRYLDIDFEEGNNTIELDFNLSYNPYCAYNPKYSCPIVPNENSLNIEIKAGEKKYKK